MKGSFVGVDTLRSLEVSTAVPAEVSHPSTDVSGGPRIAVISVEPAQVSSKSEIKPVVYGAKIAQLKRLRCFTGKSGEIVSTLCLDTGVSLTVAGIGESPQVSEEADKTSTIENYYFLGETIGREIIVKEGAVAESSKSSATSTDTAAAKFGFSEIIVMFNSKSASVDELTAFLHRLLFVILRSRARIQVPSEALYSAGKAPNENSYRLEKITLLADQYDASTLAAIFNTARTLAEASCQVALVTDCPPNILECQFFSKLVADAADRLNVSCKILDENDCKQLGMGAFTAVASGSKYGCRLVHLTYKSPPLEAANSKAKTGSAKDDDVNACSAKRRFAFVGKGITMDTGGYNVKPFEGMISMKCDMAGAATMLFSVLAIAALELDDVEVHAIGALCENMIDANAYRPGDIIKAANGKTIEVLNTDAEGRLALADALWYAEHHALGQVAEVANNDKDRRHHANAVATSELQSAAAAGEVHSGSTAAPRGIIIDAATLTGAALIATGNEVAPVMSNREELRRKLCNAGAGAGEALWPLPLRERYAKGNKGSPLCDVTNIGMPSRRAGTIMAGLFLKEFVTPATPWAHIDIAGPAYNMDKREATGFGVATLVNFVARS